MLLDDKRGTAEADPVKRLVLAALARKVARLRSVTGGLVRRAVSM